MYQLLEPCYYQEFLKILQDNYKDAHIMHHLVLNVLNGKIPSIQILVDTWPEFQIAVLKLTGLEDNYLTKKNYVIFTRDNKNLETFLYLDGLIDIKHSSLILVLQNCNHQILMNGIQAKFNSVFLKVEIAESLCLSKEDLNIFLPLPGMSLKPISTDLIDTIHSNWPFGDEVSREYFSYLLDNFNSLALYDVDSSLIGYILETHYGTVGMLRVVPGKQGRGYSKILLSNLCKLVLDDQRKCFSSVIVKNVISMNLHLKIGFIQNGSIEGWFNYTQEKQS